MKTKPILSIMFFCAFILIFSAEGKGASRLVQGLKYANNQNNIAGAGMTIHNSEQKLSFAIREKYLDYATSRKLEMRMQSQNRPEVLIPLFMPHLLNGDLTPLASSTKQYALAKSATGGISGKVTVAGGMPDPNFPIKVVAFDSLGYYASQAEVDNVSTEYSIPDMMPGSYYVMTVSNHFVDEIYNDVVAPLDNRETWRMATRVQVADGDTTTAIDFDLQKGARISGRIFHPGGTIPLQEQEVTFIFSRKDLSSPIYETTEYIFSGNYNVTVPLAGEYKMAVKTDDYMTTWYGNTSNWNAAEPISIPTYQSLVGNINFILVSDPVGDLSGIIGGAIRYGDSDTLPFLSAVYAFDLADTSLNMTIGINGTYTFEGLPQGDYILYANDIGGNLIYESNYLGQYYENARTPDQAKPVTLKAGQFLEGIHFVLERGGNISGRVTNTLGAPVDSILIMALNADLGGAGKDPFLTRLAIYLCGTDADGRYVLEGLPTASYIVRTISDSLFKVDFLGLNLNYEKQGGKYVDEYYGDVQNIFHFQEATQVPVTVPNTTDGIDFVLEDAKYFTGTVKDAVSGAPVTNIMLFALNDTSGVPYFSLNMILKKQVQISGDFKLGPLPSGKYKLIAVAGGLEFKTDYLSEFYDGVRLFEQAPVLTLDQANLGGIHFTLDRGAVIQGFVDLPQNGGAFHTGADTLDGFPVFVFDANTGQLANLDFVQFTGGYRVDHLLPGDYKILALPTLTPFAATYYGGGNHFTDPLSQTITLTDYGQITDCNITLETADGSIAGQVLSDDKPGTGLSQIMVIAYDGSGHPCGLALTDMNLRTGWVNPDAQGTYVIEGLRSGSYFLRTYSPSSVLSLSEQVLGLVDMITGDFDPLALLGSLNEITALLDLDLTLYQDQWYQEVPAVMDVNLMSLVFALTAYGIPEGYDEALLPVYLPLPVAEEIPANATAILVSDGSQSGDNNFVLQEGDLGDVFTGVENDELVLPDKFMVSSNYPNPFNPTTTITVHLPAQADVSAVVYNISGQQVKKLFQRQLPPGSHRIQWKGLDERGWSVPAGIYLMQVSADGMNRIIKMTLLK
ncbi:T9SS type A sorting domain-containing protein [candidate division KSB1 bacterium]|nr:T9SS type A sorting domain-containing protein [candidate division KSB1 bacterium]